MSQNVIKIGNTIKLMSKENITVLDKIPPKYYTISFDQFNSEYFLSETDAEFVIPEKLYSNTEKYAKRILNTFNDRSGATGVLLSGEKGTGKSLLAKKLCVDAARNLGVPTIIISEPYKGDLFFSFLQSINQPVILFYDEFEKTHDREHQEALLSLLDGSFGSKKLFILTCNDPYLIDRNMINRPGRLYYSIDFNGLEEEDIREYCRDMLQPHPCEDIEDRIVRLGAQFGSFNFDSLQAIVEELNRYGEPLSDVLKLLNVDPIQGLHEYLIPTLFHKGKQVKLETTEVSKQSLFDGMWLYCSDPEEKVSDGTSDGTLEVIRHPSILVRMEHLTSTNVVTGEYTFTIGDYTAIMTPRRHKSFDYSVLF